MFSLLLAASAATECSNTDLRRSASRWSIAEGCTSLNLSKSKLGAAEMALLAKALADHPQLTTLKLERNSLGAAGAKTLAEALRTSRLATVHLAFNSLGDEGAAALAAALPEAKALASLSIDRNEVGPRGAKALADALPRSAALRELDLSWNWVGSVGAHALAAALPNSGLTSLVLDWNSASDSAQAAVATMLSKPPALRASERALEQWAAASGLRASHLQLLAAALSVHEKGALDRLVGTLRHVPLSLEALAHDNFGGLAKPPDARLVERELLAALYAEHERQKA